MLLPLIESRARHVRAGDTNKDGPYKVSGDDSESEGAREGRLAVLADHSTDGSAMTELGRWGTDVQGTH